MLGPEQTGRRSPEGGLRRGHRVGRYVVLERIGSGGMGSVYAAYDPQLDRRVAVKVLHSPSKGRRHNESSGTARLLREAQAMAQLTHANVISVHDVGELDDGIFVAMELVDGANLRAWLTQDERSWQEVLRVFVAAGRGVEAAHAAGIVHRDFKPDNVMVADDGRVLVLDFGLARPRETSGTEISAESVDTMGEEASLLGSDEKLTITGHVLGTPAYMSPEQRDGARVGPESDQYSFCVALYEGLYGERPFGGETAAAVAFNAGRDRLRPAPKETKVPRWLRNVVVVGLRSDPASRHPSVAKLLELLERDPWRGVRRAAIAGAALVLAGAGAFAGARVNGGPAGAFCSGAAAAMDGVWDDQRRGSLKTRLESLATPYVDDALSSILPELDAYADQWQDAYLDACEDTRVRGELSVQMMDLRMTCLDERLAAFRAATDLLIEADLDVAQRAMQLTASLPAIGDCSDLDAAAGNTGSPDDPELAARVAEVRALLQRARAHETAGKANEAVSMAEAALQLASSLRYPPIEVEARLWVGFLSDKAGNAERAREELERAAFSAHDLDASRIEARAQTELVWVIGSQLAQPREGAVWAQHAEASIERLGRPPLLWARLLNNRGSLELGNGEAAKAVSDFERAVELRERAHGSDHPEVAKTLNNLGIAQQYVGDLGAARASYERALGIRERRMGPQHPSVGVSLTNLAELLDTMGEHDRALELHHRAVDILESALGKDHPHVASAYTNLGNALFYRGDLDGAIDYHERALAVWVATRGPTHPDVATAHQNLGTLSVDAGRSDQAREHLREALRINEEVYGRENESVGIPLLNLAVLDESDEDWARARERNERAYEVFVSARGEDHPLVGKAMAGLGRDNLELDELDEAELWLLRARRVLSPHAETEARRLAELRFDLAKLWWYRGRKEQAGVLARQAREGFATEGDAEEVADVEAWLADPRK